MSTKSSKNPFLEIVRVPIGLYKSGELCVLEVRDGKAKVMDMGYVRGWYSEGEWVKGHSHELGGGLRIIDIGEDEVTFEESNILLP